MSKLKVKDFDGLNVGPFAEKVSKVSDLDFLIKLEKHEEANGNRKGVLDALNKRQGELVDEVEVVDLSTKEGAKKLGEVNIELFKEIIGKMDDVEKLQEALEGVRKAEDTEMEQIVIERLAEVQKAAADVKGAGDGTTTSTKADEGTPGEDYPNGPKGENGEKGVEGVDGIPEPPKEKAKPVTKEKKESLLKEMLTEDLKSVRLSLDKMIAKIQHHMGINDTPEQSISLAKAWLGVCLGELGGKSPYDNEDKIKDRSQIPAPADRDISNAFKAECVQFNNINTEFAVIGLRKELLDVINLLQDISVHSFTHEYAIARTQAYVRAKEARFALGVILGSLKV